MRRFYGDKERLKKTSKSTRKHASDDFLVFSPASPEVLEIFQGVRLLVHVINVATWDLLEVGAYCVRFLGVKRNTLGF